MGVTAVLECGGTAIAGRKPRKEVDVCATRWARATLWNEAGMCPGINGFTKYAPIAHWSRGDLGWRIRGGVCHVCVWRPVVRGFRTHRKERDVCATRGSNRLPDIGCELNGDTD